jgi:hypothetical protein
MKANCHLIKVPFSSKDEIKKQKINSLKIVGYANYIFDINKKSIIHEYLELVKANYRLTDKNLVEPTVHYLINSVRVFRDSILDPLTKHNPKDILKSQFNDLNKEQIEEINNYLKKENTTVRNQFSYFKGSNVDGAKTDSTRTELVCTEQRYVRCNFANPMKEFLKKQKNFLNYKIVKEISLVDFIDDNEDFMKIFKESNT